MTTVEDDIKELTRQYQFLEANRKEYAKDAANTIARQQKIVEMLKKDGERLKAEYRNIMTRPKASMNETVLADLQDKADAFKTRLEAEKKQLKELRAQQKTMEAKILDLRKKMGGVNAARENQRMVNKQIRILENRLDKALVKFNEALAQNKALRAEIDNLRRERVVFDNIYRKLERELHEKKKQMANIIELSNQAYEARDQAQIEIAAIEQTNAKEQNEFEAQMASLQRRIEQEKEERAKIMAGDGTGQVGALTMAQEEELKKDVTKAAWAVAKDKAAIQVSMEKVQSYEEAWLKIKAATGIEDINELVKIFVANEDQNFSLFNYVREQNNEIEKLEEQIAELRAEESKFTQDSGGDSSQHKQLLADLEARLESTNAAAQKFESRFQEAQKTINALKMGIQSIFTKVECNTSSMSEMLAGEAVTDNNMMQYLGMIEQRTNEILQAWALLQQSTKERQEGGESPAHDADGQDEHDDGEAGHDAESAGSAAAKEEAEEAPTAQAAMVKILGQGPSAPMGEQNLRIAPPTMEDYSDVEGDDSDSEGVQMPHKIDQIKAEVLRYMALKTQPGAASPGAPSSATNRSSGRKPKQQRF